MSRVSAAVAAAACAVSIGAVAWASRPAEPLAVSERSAAEVPTTQTTLACPESTARAKASTRLSAVAPAGPGTAGQVAVAPLGEAATELGTVDTAGEVLSLALGADAQPAAVVTGRRALSRGLAAWQATREAGKAITGEAVSWCLPAADAWWFSGVSTDVGSTSRLVLTNTTPAVAVVDLAFYGPDGEVQAVGERGIAVPPQGRAALPLARFAPGLDAATVAVRATTGRVTAALHTEYRTGVTPSGVEWVPPGAPPAPKVLVGSGVAATPSQSLQITNPGDREALVRVRVLDASGAFTPSGLDDVRVGPGAVVSEDLGDIVDKDAAAVLLTANVPVTGAVVSTTGGRGADVAVSAVGRPLSGPAVVPVLPGADLQVAFASAERAGGKVRIQGFTADGGRVADQTVNLKGLVTTTWEPPAGSDAAYYTVTPLIEAAVQGVALYAGGDGLATLPVTSGPTTVTRPDVAPGR